jgi:excisionase family DNA binding protein
MGKTDDTRSPATRRLYRLKDAARYLSLSPWKVRQLIHAGEIPFIQPDQGSPYLIDQKDLDRYVETRKHTHD